MKETVIMNLSGIHFFKTEGNGNDFVALLDLNSKIKREDIPEIARRLCNRNISIGGDGVIVIQPSDKADLKMIYYNNDGSYAALCGNGLRTVGLLAYREKISGDKLTVETDSGISMLEVTGPNMVRNSFNSPKIVKKDMKVQVSSGDFIGNLIDVGIPYFCVSVKDLKSLKTIDVDDIGAQIRKHPDFGVEGSNATFVSIEDEHNIRIRIFERGIEGETLSSGTGSYSSAVSSVISGFTLPPVKVHSPGGSITVDFQYKDNAIEHPTLEGSARIVFKGEILD